MSTSRKGLGAVLPIGPTTSAFLRDKPKSSSEGAVRRRDLRLNNDDWAERERQSGARNRARRAQNRVTEAAKKRASSEWPKAVEATVRRHLAKGRDVSDIAVREGLLVSTVQAIVDQINAEGSR